MAVDGGYDKIAFPTGKQVADLYNVRKYISEIQYESPMKDVGSDKYLIQTYDKDGNKVRIQETFTKDELIDTFGKQISDKIIDGGEWGTLEGVDLEIGGEMHNLIYDEQIPQRMAKLVKKYGGRLGTTNFQVKNKDAYATDYLKKFPNKQPSIDVTPKMREENHTSSRPRKLKKDLVRLKKE